LAGFLLAARRRVDSAAGISPRIDPITPVSGAVDDDETEPAATTPDPADSVWDSCPWLADLRVLPGEATWPRLMSGPHPAAVGSYGAEAAELAAGHGVVLRWWQRLALARLLEHDDAGALVWIDALVTTARQVGKSWLLRALADWRMSSAGRFGAGQLVLHTGKDLAVCREVQRPARIDGRRRGFTVRETNGQEEISRPDGSRWLVRGQGSVYGYAVTLAVADEAWKLPPSLIEEGLEPTLAEQTSGQLVLFSTAHRACTSLVPVRRLAMIGQLDAPGSGLLLEWSAVRDAEPADRGSWRAASPHWSPNRQRLLEAKLDRARLGSSDDPDDENPIESFRSQFLNVWPVRRLLVASRPEPLVSGDMWAGFGDVAAEPPAGPAVVAVEDFYGAGAAVAVAVGTDVGVFVWAECFAGRADAYGYAAHAYRPGGRVLVGASLPAAELAELLPAGTPVERRTTTDTAAALPLLRSLVGEGRVRHAGSPALAQQVASVGLVPTAAGGLAVASRGNRADALRAASWAVMAATGPAPLPFFAY